MMWAVAGSVLGQGCQDGLSLGAVEGEARAGHPDDLLAEAGIGLEAVAAPAVGILEAGPGVLAVGRFHVHLLVGVGVLVVVVVLHGVLVLRFGVEVEVVEVAPPDGEVVGRELSGLLQLPALGHQDGIADVFHGLAGNRRRIGRGVGLRGGFGFFGGFGVILSLGIHGGVGFGFLVLCLILLPAGREQGQGQDQGEGQREKLLNFHNDSPLLIVCGSLSIAGS